MFKHFCNGVACFVMLGATSVAWAGGNLLVNGDFEDGPAVGNFVTLTTGSTALTGWTVTLTSIDIVGTGWQQVSGSRSIDMDGSPGPGGLEQVFATTPDAWYTVSFLFAGNPQCGPTIKQMRLSAAGQSSVFSFDVTGHTFGNLGWEQRHWCFRAVDETTTIAFTSLTQSTTPCGAALDNVIVELGTQPMVGDLNCDGDVDIDDRAQFCLAMNTEPGEANYVASADINDDGSIDYLDLQLFNDVLPPCIGDIVTSISFLPPPDAVTDGADLAFLLGAWGSSASCADFVTSRTFQPPADGVVDGADLAVLLGAWGACR